MSTEYWFTSVPVIVMLEVEKLGSTSGWGFFSNLKFISTSVPWVAALKVILPPYWNDNGYKAVFSFAKPAQASAPDGKV